MVVTGYIVGFFWLAMGLYAGIRQTQEVSTGGVGFMVVGLLTGLYALSSASSLSRARKKENGA